MNHGPAAEVRTATSDTMHINGLILDLLTVAACPVTPYEDTLPPLVVLHQASQTDSVNEWGAILTISKLMNHENSFKAVIARLKTPDVT